jgi:hypothetical protein
VHGLGKAAMLVFLRLMKKAGNSSKLDTEKVMV